MNHRNDMNVAPTRRQALKRLVRWSAASAVLATTGALGLRTLSSPNCRVASACKDCHELSRCDRPEALAFLKGTGSEEARP